jgi:hypothetical protein
MRGDSALPLLASVAYLGTFGSVVYVGDFPFSEEMFFFAPLLFGAAVRRWWAVAVPLVILLPLPILLAIFPPGDDSEDTALGIGFLVAFWVVIQAGFVALAVGLRRLAGAVLSQPRSSP